MIWVAGMDGWIGMDYSLTESTDKRTRIAFLRRFDAPLNFSPPSHPRSLFDPHLNLLLTKGATHEIRCDPNPNGDL